MMNMNGMFSRIKEGMCRLSMNGNIAIKTDGGYKSYNVKTGRLTNCDNFAFEIGSEFFFVVPTNHVKRGDIILVDGKPRCVIEVKPNAITALNYENSEIATIVPERHILFGKNYFYGKIVSMFGNNFSGGKNNNKIFKYMMLSSMMGDSNNSNDMSKLMPMMMFMGKDNPFEDMFDFDEIFDEDENDSDNEDYEEEDAE